MGKACAEIPQGGRMVDLLWTGSWGLSQLIVGEASRGWRSDWHSGWLSGRLAERLGSLGRGRSSARRRGGRCGSAGEEGRPCRARPRAQGRAGRQPRPLSSVRGRRYRTSADKVERGILGSPSAGPERHAPAGIAPPELGNLETASSEEPRPVTPPPSQGGRCCSLLPVTPSPPSLFLLPSNYLSFPLNIPPSFALSLIPFSLFLIQLPSLYPSFLLSIPPSLSLPLLPSPVTPLLPSTLP